MRNLRLGPCIVKVQPPTGIAISLIIIVSVPVLECKGFIVPFISTLWCLLQDCQPPCNTISDPFFSLESRGE